MTTTWSFADTGLDDGDVFWCMSLSYQPSPAQQASVPACSFRNTASRFRFGKRSFFMKACLCVVMSMGIGLGTGGPTLLAQGNGELTGLVLSPQGEALPLATVQLFAADGNQRAQAADLNGRYAFSGLAAGTYKLVASYVGYQADTVLVEAAENRVRKADVRLRPKGSMGPGVVIHARQLIQAGGEELVQPISGEELRRMPYRDPIAAVGGRSARVYDRDGDGGTLHVAGSRSDAVAYYVDGVRMVGSLNVPSSAVAEVTLYAGGIPAQYGDATGGVIVIRTKSYLAFLD